MRVVRIKGHVTVKTEEKNRAMDGLRCAIAGEVKVPGS